MVDLRSGGRSAADAEKAEKEEANKTLCDKLFFQGNRVTINVARRASPRLQHNLRPISLFLSRRNGDDNSYLFIYY